MSRSIHAPLKGRYAKRGRRAVDFYRESERDKKETLLVYVAKYEDRWRDAHACGISHREGIWKLIEELPAPWKEWAKEAAEPFLWRRRPDYIEEGDMDGFLKVLLTTLVDARDGPPPYPPPRGQSPMSQYRYERETPRPRVPKRAWIETEAQNPHAKEDAIEDKHMVVATYVVENAEEEEEEPMEDEEENGNENPEEDPEEEEDPSEDEY